MPAVASKKRKRTESQDPAQMTFVGLFTTVSQGDGTYRLIPQGRPVDELTPREFGRAVGGIRRAVPVSTVYDWINSGHIKREEWRRVGPRKLLIRASAVLRLRDTGED